MFFTLLGMSPACSDDSGSSLLLDGNADVEAITVSGVQGDVDTRSGNIEVSLPAGTDLSDLRVDDIRLSDGAVCDMPAGTRFNGSVPRAINVVNGNVSRQFMLFARHENVEFLTFVLDGSFVGAIDNEARTVTVFVLLDADVSAMQAVFTVNEGTTVLPASGSVIDFSSPVKFEAVHGSAKVEYTVTVIKDEMSQEPKAFIGNADSVDQLGDEARAACRWMLENVPNSRYVSLQQVIDGTVVLSDFKMIWAHLDFTDWPSRMWDSRDAFNSYWLHGGAILATRDGARYINDVWRISRDQQSPNDMFGGDASAVLSSDMGFSVAGHSDHPLYDGIDIDAEGRILLLGKGCMSTGRTLQWNVAKDPYGSMQAWQEKTGAVALGSAHDRDDDIVTVAEFAPYEALKGFSSGRVITIGTPAYEWNDRNNGLNPYRDNIIKLTKNAINYLCQ